MLAVDFKVVRRVTEKALGVETRQDYKGFFYIYG
jgi:hypothetical protein